jgi:hypothetical protein
MVQPGGMPPGGLPPGGMPPGMPMGMAMPMGMPPMAMPAPMATAQPMAPPEAPLPEELRGGTPRPLPRWAPGARLDVIVLLATAAIAAGGVIGFKQLETRAGSVREAYIVAGVGLLALLFGIGFLIYNARLRGLLTGGKLAVGRVLSARIVTRRRRSGGKTRTSTSLRVEYEFPGPSGKMTGRRAFTGGDIWQIGQPSAGATAWICHAEGNPGRNVPWGFDLTGEQKAAQERTRRSARMGAVIAIVVVIAMLGLVGGISYWGYRKAEQRKRDLIASTGGVPGGGSGGVRTWDGKSPLVCKGGDEFTVENVTADLPGQIAVLAQNGCRLTIKTSKLSGAVAVTAQHNRRRGQRYRGHPAGDEQRQDRVRRHHRPRHRRQPRRRQHHRHPGRHRPSAGRAADTARAAAVAHSAEIGQTCQATPPAASRRMTASSPVSSSLSGSTTR